MAAYGNGIFGRSAVAAALRQPNQPPAGGGTVQGNAMGGLRADSGTGDQVSQMGQQYSNPIDMNTASNIAKYLRGAQGAGSVTGAEIGNAANVYGPEVAKMGGNVAMGADGASVGGGGFMGKLGSLFGGGGGSAGGAGSGALGAGGGLAGLAALSFLGDKEMNENPNSMINADKLNDMGTIGSSGIGLRAGDFANAFNPATWVSDPKKGAKAMGNAFTFGLLDKIL